MHPHRFLVIVLLGAGFLAHSALAVIEPDGALDLTFNAGIITNGSVNASALQSDGKLLILGSFTKVNGVPRQKIARLNPDGTLDATFNAGAGPNFVGGNSSKLIVQPSDGKILVHGSFTAFAGVPRNGIARLETNGALDAAFDPGRVIGFDAAAEPDGSATNPGAVNDIVLLSDEKIVVVGAFFNIITSPTTADARSCVAQFERDGSYDPAYDPGTGFDFTSDPFFTRADVAVKQSTDEVIVAGQFDTCDGNTAHGMARLNTDGSFDAVFNSGTGPEPAFIGGSFIGLFADSNDNIVVWGTFEKFDGIARNRIARLGTNGTLDLGFATDEFKDYGDGGVLLAVAEQADGKLLVGGHFHSLSALSANNVVRLNTDGTHDTSFNTSGSLGCGINAFNAETLAIRPSDGVVFIGGTFATYGGENRNSIALAKTSGAVDTSFAPSSGVTDSVPQIRAIIPQASGKIVVGGIFSSINGVPRSNLVRLNPDGSIDATFGVTTGTSRSVRAMVEQPNGKILIAGAFSAVDGVPRPQVARLNADGTLDASFDPGAGGPDGQVLISIALDATDGSVYVGGPFGDFDGTPRDGLAKLSSTGALDLAFVPGPGLSGLVFAIAPPNGAAGVVVAGSFTNYNGTPVGRIARLSTVHAGLDVGFDAANGTGFNTTVRSLQLTSAGKYLAGGSFASFDGTARACIARLDGTGALDATFTPPGTTTGTVFSLSQTATKIYAGGTFSVSANRVARFLSGGGLDPAFSAGAGPTIVPADSFISSLSEIDALAIQPDGKLLIGGLFNNYNGTTRVHLARLTDSQIVFTAVSRRLHGGLPFDINLPLTGNPGIECRSGGATNDYQIVFTFASAVTFANAAVSSGAGSVSSSSGSGTTTVTVNLTGVTNAQTITVTLAEVSHGSSTTNMAVQMGVLLGDINAVAGVAGSDVNLCKAQVGATLTQASGNFRADVNTSGSVTGSDVNLVKAQVGTVLASSNFRTAIKAQVGTFRP